MTPVDRLADAFTRLALPDCGEDFFHTLCEAVRTGLAGDGACLARLGGDGDQLDVLAKAGACLSPCAFSARLDDTPCAALRDPTLPLIVWPQVARREEAAARQLLANGLQSFHGAPLRAPDGALLGVLCVFGTAPCEELPLARALLQVAAARATEALAKRCDTAAIRDREARLSLALEAGHLTEAEWDPGTDRLVLQGSWFEHLGYKPDELGSSRAAWFDLVHPEDCAATDAALLAMLKGAQSAAPTQFRLRTRDGRWRWVELRARVADRGNDGRVSRVLGVLVDVDDSRRTADMLRERSEFLEAAVRGSMDGIWEWDIAADRGYFSPRAHEMLGYPDGELPTCYSEFVRRIFHPDDLAAREVLVSEALRSQSFVDREVRMRTKHGEWRWFRSRGMVLRDPAGQARRIIGSASDITEIKHRETELADARRQLQEAIEHIDVGLLFSDANERVVLCNSRYREMYGYTAAMVAPGTPLTTLARDLLSRVPTYRRERDLETAVAWRMQLLREHRTGWELQMGDRWHLISDFPTGDGGVVSLRADITERRRTEQALRESEARLRTVLNSSPVGLFLTDVDGSNMFGNRLVSELLGQPGVELIGKQWMERLEPVDRAGLEAAWRTFVSEPRGEFEAEVRLQQPGQDGRVLFARVTPILQDGGVLGYAGTLEDVTTRRAAEQQRVQSQKMEALGHLTGGIAHDFNNLLASVLGYTRLAHDLTARQADPTLQRYLDSIREAGEVARDLIAKLLAFSRDTPSGAAVPLAPEGALNDALRFLQPLIPASVRLRTQFARDVGGILADPIELNQALVNLALNARDAIAEHGTISFVLHPARRIADRCASCHAAFDGEFVEIAVADTGSGIPGDVLPRLFEPFFSTKAQGKGSGMGLAVTHGIVHRAGGHVLIATTPGNGTTVSLLFEAAPLADDVPEAPRATVPASPVHPDARVLVVDDEPLVAGFLRELLERAGYRVELFTDPLAALHCARDPAVQLDAVVTDQTMPGLSGLELAAAIRDIRGDVPIILCSGYSEQLTPERLSLAKVDRYFTKPVPMDALLQGLDDLLRSTRQGPATRLRNL